MAVADILRPWWKHANSFFMFKSIAPRRSYMRINDTLKYLWDKNDTCSRNCPDKIYSWKTYLFSRWKNQYIEILISYFIKILPINSPLYVWSTFRQIHSGSSKHFILKMPVFCFGLTQARCWSLRDSLYS